MAVATSVMLDTIGANAANIPLTTYYVAGYVSGLGDVPWSQAQFDRFPTIRKVRIWQGAGVKPSLQAYDVIDVESGAVTPQEAAQAVKDRVTAGIQWTTVYGSDSVLAQVTAEIQKFGNAVWNGHVNYFLADWNLNEAEAAALLDTHIHGASCVAVQWASPSSNPNTVVPGGSQTLSQANIDISVVDTNWVPSGGFGPTPVPIPPPPTFHGVLVTTDGTGSFVARQVVSHDDINWQ
jgi:hypothetical protein